ncbi:MAG: response regulator [Pseudomonadota bacterium]
MQQPGRRLLIADDDAEIREMVRRVARPHGFEVIEAANAAEAQMLATEQQPDLIVLDIAFPGEDGRDILATLKTDPRTAKIPVLVWSGRDAESARRISLSLGAEDFVEKASAQTLITRINRLMLRLAE